MGRMEVGIGIWVAVNLLMSDGRWKMGRRDGQAGRSFERGVT